MATPGPPDYAAEFATADTSSLGSNPVLSFLASEAATSAHLQFESALSPPRQRTNSTSQRGRPSPKTGQRGRAQKTLESELPWLGVRHEEGGVGLVDGEGLHRAALGRGTPFAVPGFRSSGIRDRTSIISMTFCTTGVYGVTNAWAGGLYEPPAFFVPGAQASARRRSQENHTSAMTLARPPVASFTFAAPTTSVAPASGTLSRLATFSSPQRPDGSQI
jgi:hypothetical protein